MVQSFTYLGSLIDANNDISVEIKKKRILLANKGFYRLKRQFRWQFLSIKNKIKLYKTLIRPVLTYGYETWVLSKSDEARLGVFKRKVLRAIFEPTNDNREWRIKYNYELYTLYKDTDITTYIKINPLKPKLNPICYLLALLGAHHFLHVSRIRVKLLTFRLLMS